MEEKIQKLMKSLNISREEAIELMDEDKRIDRGEKLYELDPELEAGAKKARQADRKKSDTPVKRERKESTTGRPQADHHQEREESQAGKGRAVFRNDGRSEWTGNHRVQCHQCRAGVPVHPQRHEVQSHPCVPPLLTAFEGLSQSTLSKQSRADCSIAGGCR